MIQDRFILQVLQTLVSNLPPALHLVLLTREDPDLPLARLRAGNQLTESALAISALPDPRPLTSLTR